MIRQVLVRVPTIQGIAGVLTGLGRITGIDHEGTIAYELEGEDVFELGRLAADIEAELRGFDSGAEILSGAPRETPERSGSGRKRRRCPE